MSFKLLTKNSTVQRYNISKLRD